MKNAVFLDVTWCGYCKNRRFRRTFAYIIMVSRNYQSEQAAQCGWRRCIPPKRRFLQESQGVTSQKKAFAFQRCTPKILTSESPATSII
jgi:hypothetical protein